MVDSNGQSLSRFHTTRYWNLLHFYWFHISVCELGCTESKMHPGVLISCVVFPLQSLAPVAGTGPQLLKAIPKQDDTRARNICVKRIEVKPPLLLPAGAVVGLSISENSIWRATTASLTPDTCVYSAQSCF